jgi:uncharacterized membrane protein
MQWYYSIGGEQKGPVTTELLRRMVASGEVEQSDFVWNENMGEEWKAVSEISSLQGGISSIETVGGGGTGGMTHNRDLMAQAREALTGHWGLGIALFIIYMLIVSIASSFGPVIVIIGGPLMLGLAMAFLNMARKREVMISQLFDGFNQFGTAIAAYLLMSIFVFLWSLLLFIPGIIASFAYSMTFYVLADDPAIGPLEAITKSKELMRGNKWKFFCLQWRFFWWSLLCMFTCGLGFLWLYPYMMTSMSRFYDDIKPAG